MGALMMKGAPVKQEHKDTDFASSASEEQGPEKAMPRQLLKDFDQAFCAKSQPRSQSSFCIDLQSMSSPSPSRKCAPQIGSSLAGSFDASQLPHTLGLSQSLDNGFLCDNSCDPLECQQSMIHPQTASLPVVQAQPHDTCKIQTDESPVAKGIERAQEFQSTRQRAERLIQTVKQIGDWKLLSLIGMGGMSNVYRAQHVQKSYRYCAIKITNDHITRLNSSKDSCYAATVLEWDTYKALHKPPETARPADEARNIHGQKRSQVEVCSQDASGRGQGYLPVAYDYGFVALETQGQLHGWIALQLLGWSVHDTVANAPGVKDWSKFSELAGGMLAAVEKLHLQGFVHRDIKPANFCLGHGRDSSTVFLIDFGFVQPLPIKGESLYEERFSGTPDYASSNALRGGRSAAKDDCESLCYSLLEVWHDGHVAWDVTRATYKPEKDSCGITMDSSSEGWSNERLCAMANSRASALAAMELQGEIPSFLLSWMLYLSRLHPTELPNYTILQKILANSKASWADFHPASSPSSMASDLPEKPIAPALNKRQRVDSAIFAAEE